MSISVRYNIIIYVFLWLKMLIVVHYLPKIKYDTKRYSYNRVDLNNCVIIGAVLRVHNVCAVIIRTYCRRKCWIKFRT